MRAKKYLGQNFLNHPAIIRDVVAAAHITNTDTVVEIGPGKGALTREILKYAQRVIVIEKDRDLIPQLHEKFTAEIETGALVIKEGDALEMLPNLAEITDGYKVVANIPYYITGQLIRTLLTAKTQPKSITLIVQKEVAERIVCRDGKESVLSLSVKIFGNPHYVRKIGKRYFSPSPNVDSAVIHIADIGRPHVISEELEERFFELIKAGFAHKRKLLIRNLETLYKKEQLQQTFTACDISHTTRAESVSLEKWLCLHNTLHN